MGIQKRKFSKEVLGPLGETLNNLQTKMVTVQDFYEFKTHLSKLDDIQSDVQYRKLFILIIGQDINVSLNLKRVTVLTCRGSRFKEKV